MAEGSCGCGCGSSISMVYACSGSADVGALADLAARKLSKEGVGKMSCMTGIGGGVSGLIESAKAASKVLVIDGCPLDCGRKSMEKAGVMKYEYIRITDAGFTKGKAEVSPENVEAIAALGRGKLKAAKSCC